MYELKKYSETYDSLLQALEILFRLLMPLLLKSEGETDPHITGEMYMSKHTHMSKTQADYTYSESDTPVSHILLLHHQISKHKMSQALQKNHSYKELLFFETKHFSAI